MKCLPLFLKVSTQSPKPHLSCPSSSSSSSPITSSAFLSAISVLPHRPPLKRLKLSPLLRSFNLPLIILKPFPQFPHLLISLLPSLKLIKVLQFRSLNMSPSSLQGGYLYYSGALTLFFFSLGKSSTFSFLVTVMKPSSSGSERRRLRVSIRWVWMALN